MKKSKILFLAALCSISLELGTVNRPVFATNSTSATAVTASEEQADPPDSSDENKIEQQQPDDNNDISSGRNESDITDENQSNTENNDPQNISDDMSQSDSALESDQADEEADTAVTDSSAAVSIADGWNSDRTSYYKNAAAVTGFQEIENNVYFFDQNGKKAADKYITGDGEEITDPTQFADKTIIYYFDADGKRVKNSWTKGTGTKFADTDGKIIKNAWHKIDTSWYYFDAYGSVTTGWLKLNNTWYYLNTDGVMATGWKKIGNAWYYLNSSGAMATGWKQISGSWYYLNAGGTMATGWKQIGGSWYYLNAGGTMATGWKQISGSWYYLNAGGTMATGWKKIGSTWYYLNSSGTMATGWKQIDGIWYYFYNSGSMATGTVTIDGKKYTFSSSGAWNTSSKRQSVVSYMRAMATVKWHPSSTITYWCSDSRKWVKGSTYSGIPYTQYSRTTSLEQFKSYLSGSTYNGPSSKTTYKGSDCSSSVSMAWMRANSSFGIRWTGTLTPGNSGISKVGDYVTNKSNTKSSCSSTGRSKMYEAYRKLQPGDAVVTHGSNYHVRMVVSVSSGGITCIEQSGLVMSNHTSWKVDQYYSFASLYNSGYVPVTMNKW